MSNNAIITINRAAPMFKKAAEIHEQIQFALVNYREITGNLLAMAQEAGSSLEQAAITLKEGGADVKFEDALKAHAPNIDIDAASKYRKYHRGDYHDPRQLWLLAPAQPKQIEDKPERIAPAEWEHAWGFIRKLQRIEYNDWPEEQKTLTRDNLGAVVKRFGGNVVWE